MQMQASDQVFMASGFNLANIKLYLVCLSKLPYREEYTEKCFS